MYVVSSLTGTSEGGPDFPMCTLVLFFFFAYCMFKETVRVK